VTGSLPASGQPHWWDALPPAEKEIACGDARHTIRWAAGELTLPAHPDAEAELILGALGGEKTACTELARLWARHHGDLAVLALGPRSAADELGITWDEMRALDAGDATFGPRGPAISARDVRRALAATGQRAVPGAPAAEPGRMELLTLLALGPAFRMRLAATAAAAWSGAEETTRAANRPALTTALTARFALAAGPWAGVDPGQVTATLHDGPGWGSIEVSRRGRDGGQPDDGDPGGAWPGGQPDDGDPGGGWPDGGWLDGGSAGRGLRASLPLAWLACVWAAGLAVVEGHLVVAVQAARWPDAQVLALPAPDAAPVTMNLRAVQPGAVGPATPGGEAHWVRSERDGEAGSR
jgi:hypothetical protein